jgi:hypothetical protein
MESIFFFFDTIQFDSIWRRFWNQKIKNDDSKKWKFYRKWSQMILPSVSDILVYPSLKIDHFTIAIIVFSTAARFSIESNRKLNQIDIESKPNRIETESNRNRIGSKGFCPFWIENRIESKTIRSDSPGTRHDFHIRLSGCQYATQFLYLLINSIVIEIGAVDQDGKVLQKQLFDTDLPWSTEIVSVYSELPPTN